MDKAWVWIPLAGIGVLIGATLLQSHQMGKRINEHGNPGNDDDLDLILGVDPILQTPHRSGCGCGH